VSSILAFGDSLTEGVVSEPATARWAFIENPRSYPWKLRVQLTSRYSAQTFVVLNAGRAGERAEDATGRFAEVLAEARPQIVLLVHGANDLVVLGRRGIPRAIGAIETMIKEASRRGVQVFLATLPPERPGSQRGAAAPYISEYNLELVKTAADEGARLVGVGSALSLNDIGVDGLHPTEAGYDKMAATFLSSLALAYEQVPQTGPAPNSGQ
jgi:lysophospholipase L1-like esterase